MQIPHNDFCYPKEFVMFYFGTEAKAYVYARQRQKWNIKRLDTNGCVISRNDVALEISYDDFLKYFKY